MRNDTTLAIVAIIAAIGLLGLVLVETATPQALKAYAAGCVNGSHAFFQSKGNCYHP